MNYLSLNLNYEYITLQIKLTWEDIEYGIKNKYISSDIAIDHAIKELSKCEKYSEELLELASLSKGELVYPYLTKLVQNNQKPNDIVEIKDKWMYIILKKIYYSMDDYLNPLEIAEEVYSDFNYPEIISNIIRYMPLNMSDLGSVELNEKRLIKNWYEYLKKQYEKFGSVEKI